MNTELHGNKTKNKQKHLPLINTELHGKKQKHSDGCTHPVGARSKGSNGGVAVGLPHRNSSVFKQAHIN